MMSIGSATAIAQAVCLGLALAGLIASSFELFASRRAELALLRSGRPGALALVPLLVICAPFIILRDVLDASGPRTIPAASLAVLTALAWSMMPGWLVLDLVVAIRGA